MEVVGPVAAVVVAAVAMTWDLDLGVSGQLTLPSTLHGVANPSTRTTVARMSSRPLTTHQNDDGNNDIEKRTALSYDLQEVRMSISMFNSYLTPLT